MKNKGIIPDLDNTISSEEFFNRYDELILNGANILRDKLMQSNREKEHAKL